jgi:hypothetical protein
MGRGHGTPANFQKIIFFPKNNQSQIGTGFFVPGHCPAVLSQCAFKKNIFKKKLGGGGWGGQGGVERFTVIVGPGYGPFMSFFSVSAGTANSSVTQPALHSVTFSGDPRAESPTPMV